MAFLTRYGTQFGVRTVRHGRTIFVAPSAQYSGIASNISGGGGTTGTFAASDNNDGLSPERAVRTVTYAVNTLAQTGDMVILLPGTHTVTAVVTPRAGVAIYGAAGMDGWSNPYTSEAILTSTGTSTQLLSIANNNTEIGYLTLRPTTAFCAIVFGTGASTAAGLGPTGVYIHDCYFDLVTPAVSIDTTGIDFSARTTTYTTGGFAGKAGVTTPSTLSTPYALIDNCAFASGGAQGSGILAATCWVHVRNSRFFNTQGAWATPFLVASSVDNSIIERCIFTTSGAIGSCIEGSTLNQLNAVTILDCRFPASTQGKAIQGLAIGSTNAAGGSGQITESYQANSASAVII